MPCYVYQRAVAMPEEYFVYGSVNIKAPNNRNELAFSPRLRMLLVFDKTRKHLLRR